MTLFKCQVVIDIRPMKKAKAAAEISRASAAAWANGRKIYTRPVNALNFNGLASLGP